MILPLLPGALCLAILVGLMAESAQASKRVIQPLTVAVASADAIVIGEPVHLPVSNSKLPARDERLTMEVRVTGVLKGGEMAPPAPATVTAYLDRDYPRGAGSYAAGKSYIWFLRKVGEEGVRWEVMEDETQLQQPAEETKIRDLIAQTPAWERGSDGLATVLVPERYRIKRGEDVALHIGCRNDGGAPIVLSYRSWPLATHSYWSLQVTTESGERIAALAHPHLTAESIDEYFSKFHQTYDVTLAPGEMFFYGVFRINSAKQGWGYKEELDFKYYPMEGAGAYTIRAVGRNFRAGGREVKAGPVRVAVE